MFGENFAQDEPEQELTDEEKDVSFFHKRLGQRAAIVAAGPIANYILAIVLWTALFTTSGYPGQLLAGIGNIAPGSAAAAAKMKTGDRIVKINNQKVTSFTDLSKIVSKNPGVELSFEIIRGGNSIVLKATPKKHPIMVEGGYKTAYRPFGR